MLGSGTAAVSVTAVGTTGQILIGQSGADPVWTTNVDLPGTLDVTGAVTLDSTLDVTGDFTAAQLDIDNLRISGNTLSSTNTNGDINLTPDGTGIVNIVELSLTTPLTVASGGTGAGTFTDHGIVLGSGTSALSVTAEGTNDQVLIGQTGADPIWSSDLDLPGTLTLGTDLAVADGGTGASTLTDHGVLVGSGTDAVTPLTVGTNGQLLVGSTGADPVFATASSSLSSIVNTLGAGTFSQDISSSWLRVATVTIETGDVLTLADSPVEIVAAPGAGNFIEFLSAELILDYNSIAYTESGDHLVFRYTDGSGVIVSQDIESSGFITQTADTITNGLPRIDAIVAAAGAINQSLVLHNTGSNFGAGNSPLIVKVSYRIIPSGL